MAEELNELKSNISSDRNNVKELQKEIRDKDKEIEELLHKINKDKDKKDTTSKLSILGINNLKNENKELYNKIINYRNQVRKLETKNKSLQEKINILLINKNISSSDLSSAVTVACNLTKSRSLNKYQQGNKSNGKTKIKSNDNNSINTNFSNKGKPFNTINNNKDNRSSSKGTLSGCI